MRNKNWKFCLRKKNPLPQRLIWVYQGEWGVGKSQEPQVWASSESAFHCEISDLISLLIKWRKSALLSLSPLCFQHLCFPHCNSETCSNNFLPEESILRASISLACFYFTIWETRKTLRSEGIWPRSQLVNGKMVTRCPIGQASFRHKYPTTKSLVRPLMNIWVMFLLIPHSYQLSPSLKISQWGRTCLTKRLPGMWHCELIPGWGEHRTLREHEGRVSREHWFLANAPLKEERWEMGVEPCREGDGWNRGLALELKNTQYWQRSRCHMQLRVYEHLHQWRESWKRWWQDLAGLCPEGNWWGGPLGSDGEC